MTNYALYITGVHDPASFRVLAGVASIRKVQGQLGVEVYSPGDLRQAIDNLIDGTAGPIHVATVERDGDPGDMDIDSAADDLSSAGFSIVLGEADETAFELEARATDEAGPQPQTFEDADFEAAHYEAAIVSLVFNGGNPAQAALHAYRMAETLCEDKDGDMRNVARVLVHLFPLPFKLENL